MSLRFACLLLCVAPSAAFAAPAWTSPVPDNLHRCYNFPHGALWDEAQGASIVEFTVTAQGTVKDAGIVKSSGNAELDQAGLLCVARWTYKPAMRDGVAAEMRTRAQVEWIIGPRTKPDTPCKRFVSPDMLKLDGIGGVTKVAFRIMRDGSVSAMEVQRSSGSADLDKAALRCVAERRFDTRRAVINDAGIAGSLSIDWHVDMTHTVDASPDASPDAGGQPAAAASPAERPLLSPHPVAILPHVCAQEYPASARAAREKGDVTLDFVVAADGSVKDITVAKSSGFADLDEAARGCVAKWRYRPVPNEGGWQATVGWQAPPG